ncbi:MAG: hypothetical protein ACK5P7_09280 [Bdellovibrio sp.]
MLKFKIAKENQLKVAAFLAFLFTATASVTAFSKVDNESILSKLRSAKFVTDSSSCVCLQDEKTTDCGEENDLPFKLQTSVSYGAGWVGTATAYGDIRFNLSNPNYSHTYVMNLTEAMSLITHSRQKPGSVPTLRRVTIERKYSTSSASDTYKDVYTKNGKVLAVDSHGWLFKNLNSNEIEYTNYEQAEQYVDLDTEQVLDIPVVTKKAMTCKARRTSKR